MSFLSYKKTPTSFERFFKVIVMCTTHLFSNCNCFYFQKCKIYYTFHQVCLFYSWNNASTILKRFFPLSLSILKKKMSNHDIDNYKIFNMDGPYRKSLIAINKKEYEYELQYCIYRCLLPLSYRSHSYLVSFLP